MPGFQYNSTVDTPENSTMRIPKKLGMSLLIGVGWIAVSAWFIHNPPDWRYHRVLASGVGCIVAGIFTFIYYFRRRYALILKPEGFYNHSTVLDHGNHLILWSVVGDITADRQGKEIRAVIADTHAYNWTLTGIRALTRVTHEGAVNSTIIISTMAMKLPEGMTIEDLAAVMRGYRDSKDSHKHRLSR